MLTSSQLSDFDRDGFLLIEDLFSSREAAILAAHARDGERVRTDTRDMPDADGRSSKLALWMDVAGDVFGAVTASERVVSAARQLLRDDVYHWHSKVMLKEPRVGGAWEWHQDYGYWYHDGCPYPRLVSCLIALDGATRANGCLKVLVGSHHLGRLDHGAVGRQTGADPARIGAIERLLPVHYVEVPAGAALFFHCNTLHASEPNTSNRPRTSYICCYNAMGNVPVVGQGHGAPRTIETVGAEAIEAYAGEVGIGEGGR